jgi:2,3-bisphosphoglycerate-dependent phosphoglycerate mutase
MLVPMSAPDSEQPSVLSDSTAAIPQPALRTADMRATTVLLVRHGRSADVVPGSPESADPPLHEEGERQAQAVADRLANRPVDAVYASHLRRACDTANAIAARHGLEVEVHDDLQEVLLGDWANGEFRRRAAARDPEWVAWSLTGRWDGIPGCEGDVALRARLARKVDELVQRHPGETIVVVAHGGAINAYLAEILGIERSLFMAVENTSITAVLVGAGHPFVLVANDCSHLYDPVVSQPAPSF